MKLKVLGSSSKGNGYVLEDENVAIILECGVPLDEVKKALNFNISKIDSVLLSHSHGDHNKYVKEYLKAGLKVYASPETIQESEVSSHNWKPVEAGEITKCRSFTFNAFDLKHDVRCYGYLINTNDNNKFCFITDTHYIGYKFDGLTNIIIECNFSDEILDARTGIIEKVRKRIVTSHLSYDLCKDFLKNQDLRKVHNIVLVHLSDQNSNAKQFAQQIKKLTGKTVYAAEPGMTINFSKNPF